MVSRVVSPVYDELVEYLAQLATPEQILAFKVSDVMQERLEVLLEGNNEGELTLGESEELQQMLEFDRMVSLLKAKAVESLP